MRVMGLAGRCVVATGLLGVGLTACQWVAGIEDIELTSASSAATSTSGTGGTTGASSNASGTTASSSASGAGGAGPSTLHYKATVADCVSVAAPNPDTCEQQTGAGQMRIDAHDGTTNMPYVVFLRFDLDNAIAGRKVVAVTLRLSTTTDVGSDKSGAIWQVSPFQRTDLFSQIPSHVGGSAVAGDVGPVIALMTYNWSLPPGLVAPKTPLYLELEPGSVDSAFYWNNNGMPPPDLVIDVQ